MTQSPAVPRLLKPHLGSMRLAQRGTNAPMYHRIGKNLQARHTSALCALAQQHRGAVE